MSQKLFTLFQGSTIRGSTNQGITVFPTWIQIATFGLAVRCQDVECLHFTRWYKLMKACFFKKVFLQSGSVGWSSDYWSKGPLSESTGSTAKLYKGL